MDGADRYSANSLRRFISVLNSIRFRDEIGQVEYFGQKIVLLRRDAFSLMRKELAKVAGSAANVILEMGGRRVGTEEGKALLAKAESLRMNASSSLSEFTRIALEETNMGFGKMRLEEIDAAAGRVRVAIQNSFEADSTFGPGGPSCFFTVGYVGGLLSQLLGRDFRGKEVTCKQRGDELCLFDFSQKE